MGGRVRVGVVGVVEVVRTASGVLAGKEKKTTFLEFQKAGSIARHQSHEGRAGTKHLQTPIQQGRQTYTCTEHM